MHRNIVDIIICPACESECLAIQSFDSCGDEIINGTLICHDCDTWWRIEEGILDLLLPSLRNRTRYQAFATRYGLVVDDRDEKEQGGYIQDQLQQQIDFFAVDSKHYERDVTCSPYFKALDDVAFAPWVTANVPETGVVLEVGVGTGRQCVRLAEKGATVVGIDISEEMLTVARKVISDRGLAGLVTFVVADACNLPCREQCFDAAVAVGTLHHVPEPEKVTRGIGRALKDHASFFSYDPHDSPVRFIFDALMRWWKLYDEEASDDPLFGRKDIHDMMAASALVGRIRVSTYLPPHLFYLLPAPVNRVLLRLTDLFFGVIPGVRNCGGMILFDGRKE